MNIEMRQHEESYTAGGGSPSQRYRARKSLGLVGRRHVGFCLLCDDSITVARGETRSVSYLDTQFDDVLYDTLGLLPLCDECAADPEGHGLRDRLQEMANSFEEAALELRDWADDLEAKVDREAVATAAE